MYDSRALEEPILSQNKHKPGIWQNLWLWIYISFNADLLDVLPSSIPGESVSCCEFDIASRLPLARNIIPRLMPKLHDTFDFNHALHIRLLNHNNKHLMTRFSMEI